VTVPIPERAYDVVVGHGLLEDAARYLPEFPKADRAFVIVDRGLVDRVFGTLALHVVPAASGPTQVRRVLDSLSRVRPSGASPSSRRGSNGVRAWPASGAELTVMLSPLISREALDRAVSLGRHGLPVVVIDTLPSSVVIDDDPYASLAWRIRLLDRRREIRRVQQAGIPVVRWLGPGSLDQFLRDVARRASAPRMRLG